jgi:hypothetical protein
MNKIKMVIEDNIYLIFLKCASVTFFGTLFSFLGCSYIYKYFSIPDFSKKEKEEVYGTLIKKRNEFTEEQLKEMDFIQSYPIFYKPDFNKKTNEFQHSNRIYDTYIKIDYTENNKQNHVKIETPNTNYYIKYNYDDHRFDYWSDFNISFLYLLVGARKFVVTENQECIYKLNFNDVRTILNKQVEDKFRSDDDDDDEIDSNNHLKHKKIKIDKENDYLFIKAKPKINKEINNQKYNDIYESNKSNKNNLKNNLNDLSNNTLYNYIHFDLDDNMFIDNELTTFINKTIQFKKCGSLSDFEEYNKKIHKENNSMNDVNTNTENTYTNTNNNKTDITDLPKPKTISFSEFKKMNLYKL